METIKLSQTETGYFAEFSGNEKSQIPKRKIQITQQEYYACCTSLIRESQRRKTRSIRRIKR